MEIFESSPAVWYKFPQNRSERTHQAVMSVPIFASDQISNLAHEKETWPSNKNTTTSWISNHFFF